MAYPFVRSAVDLGRASGPRLGIAWHMAEGGGTVGYLSRQNPNGVSVHFVVEYSGRVVQMLALDHLHTSLRVTAIRKSDDPAYQWAGQDIVYGATAARAVLGGWWLNPNNATIGVEVEGFAKDGPKPEQADAIAELWDYLVGKYPGIRSLGHRDFADYKACPGKRFPWDRVGGHGEAVMPDLGLTLVDETRGVLRFAKTTPAYTYGGTQTTVKAGAILHMQGTARSKLLNGTGRLVGNVGGELLFVGLSVAPEPDANPAWPDTPAAPAPEPQAYDVTVGGKAVGKVTLP